MSTAEQLERESELTRSQISDTLDELRASMTPGRVFDQIADRVGDAGGAAFVGNLKRQTIDNPLPVALIGAGLVWLMFGDRWTETAAKKIGETREAARQRAAEWSDAAARQGAEWTEVAGKRVEETREAASRKASEWGDKASGLAGDISSRLGSAAEGARQSAADAVETARQTANSVSQSMQQSASEGYDSLTGGARRTMTGFADSTRAASRGVVQSGNALVEFCREQPVLLAGLGLAIGAAIGAALPRTETENRLMGDASANLKEQAQGLAAQQYQAAKNVGEKAFEAAKDEATNQMAQQGVEFAESEATPPQEAPPAPLVAGKEHGVR